MPDMHKLPKIGDRILVTLYLNHRGEHRPKQEGPATVDYASQHEIHFTPDNPDGYEGVILLPYGGCGGCGSRWEPLSEDPPGDPNTPGLAHLISYAQQLEPDALKVLALLADRLVKGRETYGDLQLAKDKRNLNKECLDEVLDGLWYAAAGLLKASRP